MLSFLSVIRPSMGYGGEIWESNTGQLAALESIFEGEDSGLKLAVRGDGVDGIELNKVVV